MLKALMALLVVLAGLAGAAAYLSMFIVHVNEQAVVLTFGRPEQVINQPGGKYGPGLYFRIPLVQTVDYFDKRILDLDSPPYEVNALDQKRLWVDAFARYRIIDPLLFYQSVRNESGVRDRLKPIIESSLRRVLGSVSFQEIVRDKREDLMKRIAKQVNNDGKEFGLEVVDVRIKRADLPEQNQKNVFERMRAERQREAAEIRAEGAGASNKIKADADRQVTVIKAEAPAGGRSHPRRGRCGAQPHLRRGVQPRSGLFRLLPLHAGLRGRHEGRRERDPDAVVAGQRVLPLLQQSQWCRRPD